jgi:hypothetical protein
MNAEDDDQLGAGLVYEDLVPMRWRKSEDEIKPSQLIRIDDSNEEILRFISVLDDYGSETASDSRSSNTGDITRIEHKVNLILDLVSQILVHNVDLPDAVPIRMSASGIQWQCDTRLDIGQYIFLDIYFYHNYPRPIVLVGQVQGVDKLGAGYDTRVGFEYMSDMVRRWLDKIIFRHHRRVVAHARRQSQDSERNEVDANKSDGLVKE